jgi:hypothetical protein
METDARARGLAGWARGRALGDIVSGRRVAAAKVPSAYTRLTARSVNSGAHCASAQCAILIGSAPIKNPRIPLKPLAMLFSNRLKKACFGGRFSHVLRSKNHHSPVTYHAARSTNHYSPITHF